MTDKEKAIVMAFSGTCMLTGDKFNIFHEYVEKLMGRPVYTHELGFLADEIKEKARDDFIGLCKEDTELDKTLDKIRAEILEEAEYAYANFDRYKEDILYADPDELPDDDFRYGLERAVEIINKYEALEQEPSEDEEVIKVSKGAVKARQGRFVIYDVEWLKKNFYVTEEKIYGQPKDPCEDCISRKAEFDGLASIAKAKAKSDAQKALMGRVMFFTEQLPPVTPKYTDEEIDRAQAVEQIEKKYAEPQESEEEV